MIQSIYCKRPSYSVETIETKRAIKGSKIAKRTETTTA